MVLQDIFEKVKVENAKSKEKHGMWVETPALDQADAIRSEVEEWEEAYYSGATHGDHGEIAELIQIMNVCARRVMFLTGEADA